MSPRGPGVDDGASADDGSLAPLGSEVEPPTNR